MRVILTVVATLLAGGLVLLPNRAAAQNTPTRPFYMTIGPGAGVGPLEVRLTWGNIYSDMAAGYALVRVAPSGSTTQLFEPRAGTYVESSVEAYVCYVLVPFGGTLSQNVGAKASFPLCYVAGGSSAAQLRLSVGLSNDFCSLCPTPSGVVNVEKVTVSDSSLLLAAFLIPLGFPKIWTATPSASTLSASGFFPSRPACYVAGLMSASPVPTSDMICIL